MSTFLNDAKTFYHDFFDRGTWSDIFASEILYGKEDINKRKECIKEIYKIIMDNEAVSDAVKDWVKTNHSIQDTAKIKGVSVSMVKNQIYYINTTIGGDLTYRESNILMLCLLTEKISEYDWKEINKIIQAVKIKRCKSMYNKESILNSRNLLVNIPRKEYNTAITDNQFNDFLRLITPYFITERKRIQLRINTEFLDEAGYINYIMTPGITLSELDKQRLKKIKSLLDEETLNTYKQLHKAKLLDITGVEEEMKNEEADYSEQFKKELEEGKHLEVKTKRIQYSF